VTLDVRDPEGLGRDVASEEMQAPLGAQREALIRLRDDGEVSGDVLHRVERDLDVEEARLDA
jgi:hypothetical protein